MSTEVDDMLQNLNINSDGLTDIEKQTKLRDYYQSRVDTLEKRKVEIDQKIQKLVK